jgi:hypothetical protein
MSQVTNYHRGRYLLSVGTVHTMGTLIHKVFHARLYSNRPEVLDYTIHPR